MHIYHNDDITHFIRIALTYINFMYILSGSTKRLTITYYLTDNKKVQRNRILTPDEVNTGSTDLSGVTIWRKEEVYNTTIHELIHFFKLDLFDIYIFKYNYKNYTKYTIYIKKSAHIKHHRYSDEKEDAHSPKYMGYWKVR